MEMDAVSLGVAVTALAWTIFQQYRINKMCYDCPFRRGEQKS